MYKAIKHVRLVSPSRACAAEYLEQVEELLPKLEKSLGVTFSWGRISKPGAVEENFSPLYEGASPEERLLELKEAFEDDSVDALWCVRGGNAQGDLVSLLKDYTPATPKPILGMSDNTLVQCWLYQKTGLSGYYGPVLIDFTRDPGEHTLESVRRCFAGERSVSLGGATQYRDFMVGPLEDVLDSDGPWVIQEGEVSECKMMVGLQRNLVRAAAGGLHPSLDGVVLALDVVQANALTFSADLEALLNTPGAKNIAGLVVGRLAKDADFGRDMLTKIIATKEELKGKPVVANLDVGHTYPITTIPFVSQINLKAYNNKFSLEVQEI